MDLKNMTMDDLKQKFSTIDKKTLIKFGIGFGAIILFLIIYYAILNPMVNERKTKYKESNGTEQNGTELRLEWTETPTETEMDTGIRKKNVRQNTC